MTRVLKLITFDATETLMVFQPPVAVKYAECAKRFGIVVDPGDVMKGFKAPFKELSKNHPNFGRGSGLGWRAWWTEVVVRTFKSAAPSCDDKTLQQLAAFLIEEYQTARCWALADGTLDILDHLKTKGVPLGVISNYDERLESTLKSLGIHSYFDFFLTSYSAGVMKPHKEIFELARCRKPGNIAPECCAHVGNSLEFDYLGAKNAGWKPFLVGPLSANVLKLADNGTTFENLTELRKYFETALK
ncbi:hypothetical protein ONE63_004865 [Megalurothrips usitatus]|uniref:Rhythmically expressed gene 2 protein-like n=1 Tax=Megalurothrips usitatus TaxID=439358 RepID=A0AAV7X3J3_9NEOP|nr:hypothetical protein ONE63_004865 [Megalurothrips usitatus]